MQPFMSEWFFAKSDNKRHETIRRVRHWKSKWYHLNCVCILDEEMTNSLQIYPLLMY